MLRLSDLIETAKGVDSHLVISTDVIIVVKGAGAHAPDETLDVFLRRFWPAVKCIDRDATIVQRHDVFPNTYRSSPHDEGTVHNHVTEIQVGERRIWLKEAYWEPALRPGGESIKPSFGQVDL